MICQKPTISQRFMARELRVFEDKIEKVYSPLKRKLFSVIKKTDKVLEIGSGTGVNFKYYPKCLRLSVVEPNVLLHDFLRRSALKYDLRININTRYSENLPFRNNSFDFVVSTLVLCSVNDLPASLREIKRVLKKNGRYLFIEHVLDGKSALRRGVQHIMAHSPWTFFGDNCHPNRDISLAIQKSGFSHVKIRRYYQNGLGLLGQVIKSHIIGYAAR